MPPDLLARLQDLAVAAGAAILDHRRRGVESAAKADGSPVTEADRAAEAIVEAGLKALMPEVPIVAEEAVAAGRVPAVGDRFWLVDPLDGTREFVQGLDEFTVNIALVEAGRPVLGVVHAPALNDSFAGLVSLGAVRRTAGGPEHPIAARVPPAEGLTVLLSRHHGDRAEVGAYLAGLNVAARRTLGSSLKLCLLAAGEADLYPRFGPTSEWDIAAGHAVLAAAGGSVERMGGGPLTYGKPRFENPDFVAFGRREHKTHSEPET